MKDDAFVQFGPVQGPFPFFFFFFAFSFPLTTSSFFLIDVRVYVFLNASLRAKNTSVSERSARVYRQPKSIYPFPPGLASKCSLCCGLGAETSCVTKTAFTSNGLFE